MKQSAFDRWIRQIYNTQQEELSCSECFDRLSQYADRAMVAETAADPMPCLKGNLSECPVCGSLPCLRQHLQECRVCREDYETLRDLTRRQEST